MGGAVGRPQRVAVRLDAGQKSRAVIAIAEPTFKHSRQQHRGQSECINYISAIEHNCWVREGIPPNITVSKHPINCNSGAGSIQQGRYHGFLRDGHLVV